MEKWIIIFTFTVIIISILAKIYYDTNIFKVSRVQFHSGKVPDGFELRILQISDFHNKVFRDNNQKLIKTVEKLNPDIIVITGDLIDKSTEKFENIFSLIKKIKIINDNIFYVFGNHEWKNRYGKQYFTGLDQDTVTILNNKNIRVTVKGFTFNLVGVDDLSTRHDDFKRAFHNLNQELYTILLSHAPHITAKYKNISADLILCGHTHGGQVRIPFIGALMAPGQGLFPELDKGTYKIGPDKYLYIDSGLGTSNAPIRFLDQSQLSLITIVNNN